MAACWAALAAFWAIPVDATDGVDSSLGFSYDPKQRIESARLFGNLNKYAYYFTDLLIGTPPQRTSVIIDTGSRLVGFPCTECSHCGEHLDPAFDFERSNSSEWFNCSSACMETCQSGRCPYQETYAEGSSISGYWFEDNVMLGDSFSHNPSIRVRLGCHTSENKLFYTQQANGIMGLAPTTGTASQPTILQQLFRDTEHVNTNVFAICMATWGGRMTVGGYNTSYHTPADDTSIEWVSMQAAHYYFLTPKKLSLGEGDKALTVASEQRDFAVSIVDSGTTYTYLPEGTYHKLVEQLNAYCNDNDSCGADKEGDECWLLRDRDGGPVQFPPMLFDFGSKRPIVWKASSYLHRRGEEGQWCQTFMQNNIDQTVFGISFMLHKDFVFDVGNNRLGIAEADCPEYHGQPDLDLQAKFSTSSSVRVAEPRLGSTMQSWAHKRHVPLLDVKVSSLPSVTLVALPATSFALVAFGSFRALKALSLDSRRSWHEEAMIVASDPATASDA